MKYMNEFITYMTGRQMSDKTVEEYTKNLGYVFTVLAKEPDEIKYEDLENYKFKAVNEGLSSSTIRTRLSAVKTFYEFLMRRRFITENPAEYLESVKVNNKVKIPLTPEDVRNMIKATDNIRNKALIYALATTGLRIAELASITLEQYANMVDNTIVITGKGNKQRGIMFPNEAKRYIDEYIATDRKRNVANGDCGLLFVGNQGHALNSDNTSITLKRIAKAAGVEEWQRVCNHLMRTTMATIAINDGVELPVIQKMLGHSNYNTTLRYAKMADQTALNAMSKIRF